MHQERVRSRSKVHQLLQSDGEEVQQLVSDSGRGEEGQPVGDQQTQTLVWKTGVQADGSPWVDSVPEHLTNISLGLLPGAFNVPISVKPKQGFILAFRATIHVLLSWCFRQ